MSFGSKTYSAPFAREAGAESAEESEWDLYDVWGGPDRQGD